MNKTLLQTKIDNLDEDAAVRLDLLKEELRVLNECCSDQDSVDESLDYIQFCLDDLNQMLKDADITREDLGA